MASNGISTGAHSGRLWDWMDLAVGAALAGTIYAIIAVAREWTGHLQPVAEIHLEARYLPLYSLFSLTRGVIAYGISFLFTVVYGYVMARVSGADRVMLPVLDILQSIPVLGFLPGLVLGLVHLFPHRNLGLEMASVLMIFTGQVWNMTFSFHASLRSVPEDFLALARLARLSWWQRFFRLDLSFAAAGLMWNSMMSMAGGWFFLTVSEAFVLGDHDFRLPGLGSFMSLAIERGDGRAQALGVLAMIVMIAALDQVVWRPLVAWAQKFNVEETTIPEPAGSWLWDRVRRSRLGFICGRLADASWLSARPRLLLRAGSPVLAIARSRSVQQTLAVGGLGLVAATAGYALLKYIHLMLGLHRSDWLHIWASAGMTLLRVLCAVVLASLWAIPVGVAIGRSPRRMRALQPFIQMAASFPAPMVFPLVIALVFYLGGGLGIGSVFLLLLGTQWYILFNVIAGTSKIPSEYWEVARLSRLSRFHRWLKLVLPAIFPSLLTGWMTATGGAWNASIVAEYMKHKGQTLSTVGLGALISQATEQGNFPMLAAAVGVTALTVVGFNRLVWRPLSHLAQARFTLNP